MYLPSTQWVSEPAMYLGSLFFNELMFVLHTLPYGIPQSSKSAIYGSKKAGLLGWLRRGLNVACGILFAVGLYEAALWVLLASALIWTWFFVRIYKTTSPNFKDTDKSLIYNAWALAHVGAINWIFDVPGSGCRTTKFSHILIILLNIAGAAALVIGVIVSPDLERAWGCYGPDAALSDLTSGPCASYYDICPEDTSVRCPNFAAPACLLPTTTINCGADTLRDDIASEFEHFSVAGTGILAGSLTLYILTFEKKYDYLQQKKEPRVKKVKQPTKVSLSPITSLVNRKKKASDASGKSSADATRPPAYTEKKV